MDRTQRLITGVAIGQLLAAALLLALHPSRPGDRVDVHALLGIVDGIRRLE